jgi:hypothetical protein
MLGARSFFYKRLHDDNHFRPFLLYFSQPKKEAADVRDTIIVENTTTYLTVLAGIFGAYCIGEIFAISSLTLFVVVKCVSERAK